MLSTSCSTATNSLPATNTRWPTPICSRCSTGPISTRSISQNGRTSRHTWLESVQGRRCRKPCGRKVCWDSTHASCAPPQSSIWLETDVQSLRTAWRATLNVKCPHCGEVHQISVRETYTNGALKRPISLGHLLGGPSPPHLAALIKQLETQEQE